MTEPDEAWGHLFPEDFNHPTIDETMDYLMTNLDWATEIRIAVDPHASNEDGTQEVLEILSDEEFYISCIIDRWNPALVLGDLVKTIETMKEVYQTKLKGGEGNDGYDI
jgi:hypothetical protein